MTILAHAIVRVQFIHLETQLESLDVKDSVGDVGLFSFDSDQLDMDLTVTESTEVGNNTFEISVWNTPSTLELVGGDQVVWQIYWDSDPEGFTLYSGIIEK